MSDELVIDAIRLGGSWLHERCALDGALSESGEETFERWKERLERTALNITFDERLERIGLTADSARRLLDPSCRESTVPSDAAWLELLREVFDVDRRRGTTPGADDPLFIELLEPFVDVVRARLAADFSGRWSANARMQLEEQLLRSLTDVATATLSYELHASALFRDPLRLFNDAPPIDRADPAYKTFVDSQLESGMPWLCEYPVLARLLAAVTLNFIDATRDLIMRLEADLPEIIRTFGLPDAGGEVTAIVPALSDPHANGRQVCMLRFGSGASIVYKPKDLTLDDTYQQLLAWINAEAPELALGTLRVMCRDGYGWMESVDERAPAQPALHYEKSGRLMALLYALQTADCHCANFIAGEDGPVFIDGETIAHPGRHDAGAASARRSVLGTGFLPSWVAHDDVEWRDVSMLGAPLGAGRPNAGGFPYSRGDDAVPAAVTGEPSIDARAYVEDVVRGFEQMYRFVAANRERIAPLLERMTGAPGRFIRRSTRTYAATLRRLLQPRVLRDSAEWAIAADVLLRHEPEYATDDAGFWGIISDELRALEQLDIPLFRFSRDEHLVTGRLALLSETDLEWQSLLIRASLSFDPPARVRRTKAGRQTEVPIGAGEALAFAEEIAVEIGRRAIPGGGRGLTWLRFGEDDGGQFDLRLATLSLYNGSSGVALFLGALCQATGNRSHGHLAERFLEQTRGFANRVRQGDETGDDLAIGAGSGLAGIVYALVQCSRMLGESSLLDDAKTIASCITRERIDADDRYEVLYGGAGAILGLVALHDATGAMEPIERARHAARRLVAHWPDFIRQHPSEGMAHGPTGVALALRRLDHVVGDPELAEAARVFVEAERPRGTTWCHGTAGMAIARQNPAGAEETLDVDPDGEVDHLCCGNFARITGLSELGSRDRARIRANQLLHRARAESGLRLTPNRSGVFEPSFFRGTSGIGYELLRISGAAQLPCVLRWE